MTSNPPPRSEPMRDAIGMLLGIAGLFGLVFGVATLLETSQQEPTTGIGGALTGLAQLVGVLAIVLGGGGVALGVVLVRRGKRGPEHSVGGNSTAPFAVRKDYEPSPENSAGAKALFAVALEHHYSKRFPDARAIYQQIVERHGDTKQATIARQQLENLRNA